jgi:diguanylate cyclase (GGDEF)-like protein
MRKVGLAGRFAVASAAVMIVLGTLLAQVEASQLRARALANVRDSASMLADIGLRSHLRPADVSAGVSPQELNELDGVFRAALADGRIARVKIWSSAGLVVYSDDHTLIGRTFPMAEDLRAALEGHPSSDISSLDKAENVAEQRFGQLLEVYLPLRFTAGGPPAGAFELYIPYRPIASAIAADTRRLYLIIIGGLLVLWLTLSRMVLGASRRLRRDAEDLRVNAEAKEYLALHDPLTDLPNRILFRDRVDQATIRARRDGTQVAVLIMDLDRFKEINDALGHDRGDLVLTEIAPRIRSVLRAVDTVGRLGGDEFGILLGGLHSAEEARTVANKIGVALERPFDLDDMELEVGASVGVALFPTHGDDPDALMRRAEIAMYVAKASRSGFEIYSAEQHHYTKDRLALFADLRRAIETGDVSVHYQPKVAVPGGEVVGVEALARWEHPERGSVPPDVFVPLAEQTGLVRRLTTAVLETALSQCRLWADVGLDLPVAVNLSVRDLLDATLPAQVSEMLDRYGLEARSLQLEITESSMMDQPARALDILNDLADLGVELAIDDFGTGYSSLAYLQRLPVRQLKIDRSFVIHLSENESDAAIVRSTIDLGHSLALTVVAEGVEDAASLARLATAGCDLAQGYHVARPMPGGEIEAWLASSGRGVRGIPSQPRRG